MKIKRRVVLSLLITITIAILTNKCWLLFNPISVSFGIYGQGKCNVQVLLNKKDNVDFKKIKSAEDSINLTDVSTVDLKVYRAKRPKRLRIILSDMNVTDNIVITNLKVDKFLVSNLTDFDVKGAKILIEDKKLVVHPNNAVVMLTYKNPLNVKARIKLDYMIFVTILVLTYLFSYKLTNYVADFKTIQNKSRIDILFLTLFFIFLFIPMSHINDKEISEQENRTLAKWYPLIKENNEINFEFGKNFNEWFNDRFNLRDIMLLTYQKLLYVLSSDCYIQNDIAMNKKTNWMIGVNLKNVDKYPQKNLSSERLEEISKNISMLQAFCNKNNIKPYIIIAPYKAEFCAKLVLPYLTHNLSMHDKTMQAIDYIKKKNGIQIIYPYGEIKNLFNEQPERAYFKSDHHWTDESAYLGYTKLMQHVKRDFPNIHITKENEYNFFYSKQVRVEPAINKFFIGMTARNANIRDERILDTQYKYYIYKNSDNIKFRYIKAKDKDEIKYFYHNNINAPKMYMYGDSFVLNLLPIVVNSFSDSQVLYTSQVRKDILKLYKQDITDNNTDVLIICVCDIDRLANLYKKEE